MMHRGLGVWAITAAALLLHASDGAMPLAPHQLVVVQPGGDAVVRLGGYDLDGDALTATVSGLPVSGTLKQLSAVFSDYGYEPKAGSAVVSGATVTGSANRVVYARPANDVATAGAWANFTYTVADVFGKRSAAGTVTLAPPSGVLVASHFTQGDDGWRVAGNAGTSGALSAVSWEPSSRGAHLNRYVHATDATVNVDATGDDATRWYFAAPAAFLGNRGIAYGGALEFALAAFAGEFGAADRNAGAHIVELECATCDTNAGVTLAFPLAATAGGFNGAPTAFSLALTETSGWLQDPKNTLVTSWAAPSRCTFIEVLSGLTAVRILGDVSRWYESVALDGVQLVQRAGRSLIPICAQHTPDASVCTC